MLNKNDLRIGNWIDGIQEGCYSQLENGSDIDIAQKEGLPIRITDEMIEGIGFEMKEYEIMGVEESNKRFPAFYDGFNDTAVVQYYFMKTPYHGEIELRKFDCEVIEIGIGNSRKNKITAQTITRLCFFHQLQNVMWDVFFLEIGLKEIK